MFFYTIIIIIHGPFNSTWHFKDVKCGVSASVVLKVFLIFNSRCCKGEGGGRLMIRVGSHSGQNRTYTLSSSLVIGGNQGEHWVSQNLLGRGWCFGLFFLFFNLCLSFRILTPGTVPAPLCSASIINNPLRLCSFLQKQARKLVSQIPQHARKKAPRRVRLPAPLWRTS